jgi:tetratricopeptide (TPR) repeat protein
MKPRNCQHCGRGLDETASCCPTCGWDAPSRPLKSEQHVDTHEVPLQQLLVIARRHLQKGDITSALRYAREALTLRGDYSSTHALLGQLYDKQGNHSAARYHFQCALQVSRALPSADEAKFILPTRVPTSLRQPSAVTIMVLLMGCIFVMGLAAVLTFRTNLRNVSKSAILQVPFSTRATDSIPPRWTDKVPSAINNSAPDEQPTYVNSPPTAPPMASSPVTPVKVPEQPPVVPPTTASTADALPTTPQHVLGPSAKIRGIAASPTLTLEMADQAAFMGEYDKAVTIYETVISRQGDATPVVYQNLACSYLQLGNATKAEEFLAKAIQGYKDLLTADTTNVAAQQGVDNCTAALHTVKVAQDHVTNR